MTAKVIQVAVAIITKPNGEYLLASRPDGKGWAGWWEFPGGKVEKNEAPEAALSRELQEELGITPTQTQAWIKRRYDYPATKDDVAKTVLLHFYFVLAWQGEPNSLEGQTLAWQHPQKLNVSPVLPANAPIMHALSLPDCYVSVDAEHSDETVFFGLLQQQLKQGCQLIRICEKPMKRVATAAFVKKILTLTKPFGARILLSGHDASLASQLGFDGLHLDSQALMQRKEKPQSVPKGFLVAASCHNAKELAHAEVVKVDFVSFSDEAGVNVGHASSAFEWDRFERLIRHMAVPVYASGGVGLSDLPKALACGARGIAF